MRLRDAVGLPVAWQRRLTWLLELWLVGLFFVGLYGGNVGVVVNSGVALSVTQIPPLLERDFEVPMDPALTLWITAAVFLHVLGTVGLPGSRLSFYQSVWWWDHLTHALSSSVVAAAGYATARAFDEHSDGVDLPPRFTFVFLLLFVVAFGVLWEVIEFTVSGAATALGSGSIITQYGLEDTMLDLIFDTVGAVVVAVWGAAHLTDVVGAIGAYLERRESPRGD
ncbi:MAG: hypothetical protein ABEJ31_10355 [Haloarculaceae archaeon]